MITHSEKCNCAECIVKKWLEIYANLEAENKRLREALEKIHAKSYPGLAMSVFTKESTMLNSIYRFATQALKGE